MRIAICTDLYLPIFSGIADSVAILAGQLRKDGHDVRICTLSLPGATLDPHVMRFPSYILPGSGGGMALVFPIGAMKNLRGFKPDVIHTHVAGFVGLFALYAAWRLKKPLVGTDHTLTDYYYSRPFLYFIKKFSAWYYNRCVFVTAPSEHMLTELCEYGFYRPMKVISNHIPAELFRPLQHKAALKQKYGITKNAVLIFGRIAVEKNLAFALDIFEEVAGQSDVELVFVGDGAYAGALKEMVSKKPFANRTHFLGSFRGEALIEIINACEVFLITSKSETQSMTTMQAMACGLPVVAIAAGGLPEYVHDGVNGYCVPPDNKQIFVERIIQLLESPRLRAQIGEKGMDSVDQYSPANITKQFEEIYQKVLVT